MKRHPDHTSITAAHPWGATLTEILMALMIMGIGVTSVATLFPLAVSRAARATQLTNGALLRYQVDEIIDLAPTLMPFNMPVNSETAAIGAGPAMFSGLGFVGPDTARVHIVDPLGYWRKEVDTAGTGRVWDGLTIRSSGAFANLDTARAFCILNDSWVTEYSDVPVSNTATTVVLDDNAFDAVTTASQIVGSNLPVRVLLTSADGKQVQSRRITAAVPNTRTITFAPALPSGANYATLQNVRIQPFENRYSWMITATTRLVTFGDDGAPGLPLWRAGQGYAAGDWIRGNGVTDIFYQCVQGGVSDTGAPGFANGDAPGQIFNDGSVIWVASDQPDTGDIVTTEMDLVVFFRRDFTSAAERTFNTETRGNTTELDATDTADEILVNYPGADPKPTFTDGQFVFVATRRNGRYTKGQWTQITRVLNDDVAAEQVQLQLDKRVWSARDPRNTTLTVFIPDGVMEVYPLGIISNGD